MASYEITIKDQTGSGGGASSSANPVANNEDDSVVSMTAERALRLTDDPGKKAAYAALEHIAMNKVIATTKSWINHELNMVSVATGRVELQQRMQVVTEAGSGIASLATDIAVGAKVAGGWGAAVGAILNVAGTAVNIYQKVDTINTERSLENTSIGLKNVRSGGSLATYSQSRS